MHGILAGGAGFLAVKVVVPAIIMAMQPSR